MKRSFRKGIIILAAALIVAVLGIIGVNTAGSDGPVANGLNALLRPLKGLTSRVVGMYESLYGYIYNYDKLLAENEELKKRNADLEEGYLRYDSIVEENQRLKKLLNFKDHHAEYVVEQATVLSWTASNWSRTFTINVGSANSEVAVGDSVINEAGALVGVITGVDSLTSTVCSVIDTTFAASVNIGADNTVTACGSFSLMQEGLLWAGYLEQNAGVATGDTVVTSGKGGTFPEGLLLGYVDGLYDESGELSLYAAVAPATELQDLLHVFVITDFGS